MVVRLLMVLIRARLLMRLRMWMSPTTQVTLTSTWSPTQMTLFLDGLSNSRSRLSVHFVLSQLRQASPWCDPSPGVQLPVHPVALVSLISLSLTQLMIPVLPQVLPQVLVPG